MGFSYCTINYHALYTYVCFPKDIFINIVTMYCTPIFGPARKIQSYESKTSPSIAYYSFFGKNRFLLSACWEWTLFCRIYSRTLYSTHNSFCSAGSPELGSRGKKLILFCNCEPFSGAQQGGIAKKRCTWGIFLGRWGIMIIFTYIGEQCVCRILGKTSLTY